MQQWEYCHLRNISNTEWALTIGSKFAKKYKQDKSQGDVIYIDALYRAVAELGADGWELVSQATEGLWFRRPKATP